MVAAAEAPARPVPTMMTLSLRRLAGLTSRASNWRLVQRISIGPDGALVSTSGSPSRKYSAASPVPFRVPWGRVISVIRRSSLDPHHSTMPTRTDSGTMAKPPAITTARV